MSIVITAGTRPEAIKLAPIVWVLKNIGSRFVFIWSGQHYDYEMSKRFFNELGLPEPDFDLNVRSSNPSEQIARILSNVEGVLKNIDDKGIVIAEGDTNTVLGVGLAAIKAGWLFSHVEAGLRSFNRVMPEEINRVVVDAVANVHFAPSVSAVLNLVYEGVMPWRIHLTGNTIVDVVYKVLPQIKEHGKKILEELGVHSFFGLVTLHRAENVDNIARLRRILSALKKISKEIELVFPIHPRTKKRLLEFGLRTLIENSDIRVVKPLGYFELLGILSKAQIVFTDSGGIQEEALTLAIPCITLRYNTERPETVWTGGNFLVGDDPRKILSTAKHVLENREEIVKKIKSVENPYGDGKAGERIARILKRIDEDKETYSLYAYKEPDYRNVGDPTYVLIEGSMFAGLKIDDLHRKYPGLIVTLVYDENGNPVVPFPDRVIKNGWKLRVWGPRRVIKDMLNA